MWSITPFKTANNMDQTDILEIRNFCHSHNEPSEILNATYIIGDIDQYPEYSEIATLKKGDGELKAVLLRLGYNYVPIGEREYALELMKGEMDKNRYFLRTNPSWEGSIKEYFNFEDRLENLIYILKEK